MLELHSIVMAHVQAKHTWMLLCFIAALVSPSAGTNNTTNSGNVTLDVVVKNRTLDKWNISCVWDYDLEIGKAVVAGIFGLGGLFILTCGYRHRRITFFLIGFISVSVLTYLVCIGESSFSMTINILISVASGLFISLFTTTILYCGYFVTGLYAGFAIAFAVLHVVTLFMTFSSIAVPSVVIACFALFQVFITLWWRRVLLIISTSFVGGTMVSGGVDYFVENFFILTYSENKIFYGRSASMCWYSYVVFGVWGGLVIAGFLIQFLWTGKQRHKKDYIFIYRRRTAEGRMEEIGLMPPGGSSA